MRQLTLDEIIDRYEAALSESRWNAVDLRQFIPSATSSEYWPALVELLRIRMEHAFQEDPTQGIEQCVREFPGLLQNNRLLSDLAYEEFRLRQDAGHPVTAAEYQERWDIDTSSWKCPAGSDSGAENSSSRSGAWSSANKRSVCDIALSPGENFGPFRILCLLGRGALAKVYLAQQLDLSERAVVLKVCSQATLEPQKIALLQHPHIVQIFSVHEITGYQVLCMPYAGATTLADLLVSHRATVGEAVSISAAITRSSHQLVTTLSNRQREIQTLVDKSITVQTSHSVQLNHGLSWPDHWQNMRYEDIVCELMLQLANGLSHAHHHGIVHSDLKPANVLIGDDGQARLVDFNVAQRDGDARHSLMGGTLPYMAPEHIRSLREDRWEAGAPSDLFSLGVIAFQLLSGKLPFAMPSSTAPESLDACLADRQHLRLAHQLTVQHASTDVRAIIEKLLEPQLDRRYQSAEQVAEDLRRHLNNLPLRHAPNRSLKQRLIKWSTRHPRISSATTVISLSAAAMLLMATALVYYRMQYRSEQARQIVAQFQSELPAALVMAANYKEYGDLETPTREAASVLLSTLTEAGGDKPRVAMDYLPLADKALLAANLRALDKTLRLRREQNLPAATELVTLASRANSLADRLHPDELLDSLIESSVNHDFRDLTLATKAYTSGDTTRAIELLTTLVERSPSYHAAWLLLGTCHLRAGHSDLADAAYSTSLSLMPHHWQAWYHRAQLLQASAMLTHRQDQLATAEAHYTRALKLNPALSSALFNRALCRESLGKFDDAIADAEQLISDSKELVRAHFLAARILRKLDDAKSAQEHTQAALASPAISSRDYIYLGSAQLATNRQAAVENFRRAWELQPQDPEALQSLAYLSMELKTDDQAAKWLDLWVAAAPLKAAPLASRAVFYARQGDALRANADCQSALRLQPSPRERVQVASALILLSEKIEEDQAKQVCRTQALSLLIKALHSEWQLVSEVSRDPDMKSLHRDQRFQLLVKTASAFGQLTKLLDLPTKP